MAIEKRFKKILIFVIIFLFIGSFSVPKTQAASLINGSDTITTSRPSTPATHTIKFTTATNLPAGGSVKLTFSGTANNSASPLATGFAFNGLDTAGGLPPSLIQTDGITCNASSSISSPAITCVTTAQVNAGTVITFLIGCSAGSTSCTTQVPKLINPTKTAAAGTADLWKILIQTRDASLVVIDTAIATIGTIESVQVQATAEPTLTFSITPVSGAINTGNAMSCANSESVNSGIPSTATTVNLGTLNTSSINISAQLITISTNGTNGYVLTATSSGHLINPANGFWIPDSTTPTTMTVNVPWFGIHPCGLNVNSGTWGTGATGGGINAKYAWPTITTPLTLASSATGPIGNTAGTGGIGAGLTSVAYAGAINMSIPAGVYTSEITYIATPTF